MYTVAYSEPSQMSKLELFMKIVKRQIVINELTIIVKSSILDVRQDSGYDRT